MSLVKSTLAGIAWTSAGRAINQIGSFVVTLVLARLLEPSDFGLIGMAAVLSGFLSLIGEMGLGAALVQRDGLEERHRSTAFWLSVASGMTLALLLAAAAPLIASFFREPRLVLVVRVLALDFLLSPLRSVQSALLSRAMAFKSLALVEIASVFVSSTCALALAMGGYGIWALVGRTLCSSAIQTLVLWIVSSWRPGFFFDRQALRELWRFSSHLLGFMVLNYWSRKADDLLIGRVLGPAPLGLYSRAYGTMMLPLTEITGVFGKVMFPVLSRMQDDKPRTKTIYLKAISAVSLVTFPLMLVLLVASEPLIVTLYGEQWRGMIPTLQIYCLVGAFQSIGTTVGWIYQSQGRTDWMLRWGVVASTITIGAIAVGISFGSIEAVAIAYALVNLVVLSYPLFAVPGRLIGMRFVEVVRAVRPSLGCALVGCACAWLVARASEKSLPIWLLGAAELLAGLGAALLVAHLLNVEAYRELKRLLEARSAKTGPTLPAAGETEHGVER
jgi:PST family polysaccharide transporter